MINSSRCKWGARAKGVAIRALSITLGAVALGGFNVPAAVAQSLPGSVEPGRALDALKPRMEINARPSASPTKSDVTASAVPENSENLNFTFRELIVTGSTVYSNAELASAAGGKAGAVATVADIFKWAAQLTAKYRNDGYILSQVVVPAQEIDDGTVELQVVEGYIGSVNVEGLAPNLASKVQKYLQRVKGSVPLKNTTLERYVLLAEDIPGVSIETFLAASKEKKGAATLTVKAKKKRVSVAVRGDNRGTTFVGPYKAAVTLGLAGVLGPENDLSLTGYSTPADDDELRAGSVTISQALGKEGTSVFFSGSANFSKPGSALSDINLESEAFSGSVGLVIRPIRQRSQNLSISLSGSFNNSSSTVFGVDFSEDNTRSAALTADYQFSDRAMGFNRLSLALSQGVDFASSTATGDVLASRADANPDATWVNLDLSRVQHVGRGVSLMVSGSGQVASDGLSPSREFGIGGTANGSAFDASEITGDHGVSGRLEIRFSDEAKLMKGIVGGLQVYGFGDGGAVWQRDVGDVAEVNDRLASAGVGFRFNFGSHLSGSVEVAKPHMKNIQSQGDRKPRVFFDLASRF